MLLRITRRVAVCVLKIIGLFVVVVALVSLEPVNHPDNIFNRSRVIQTADMMFLDTIPAALEDAMNRIADDENLLLRIGQKNVINAFLPVFDRIVDNHDIVEIFLEYQIYFA